MLVACGVIGAVLVVLSVSGSQGNPPPEAVSGPVVLTGPPAFARGGVPRHAASPPPLPYDRRAARPTRIGIPAIGVSAPVVPLKLDRTGALEVPARWGDTGWYTGGPRPGEQGPAVIAGHVDSTTGPAVFFRLGELRHGAAVIVRRADGSAVRFRVRGVERWPKNRFPTRRVYRRTAGSALRLITCGGTFDGATGHYRDNTIVFATRTSRVRPAGDAD